MKDIQCLFYDYLISLDVNADTAKYLNLLVLLIGLFVIIFITDFVTRKLLINAFSKFSEKSKTHFDDLLVNHKAPRNIAHIVPLILTIKLFPFVFLHKVITQLFYPRPGIDDKRPLPFVSERGTECVPPIPDEAFPADGHSAAHAPKIQTH